ncbi:MBL fold metallo-hydrolase [Candidatus Woesebacteria bacterium]|nr:MBL fold metallo-hydrolase [Candidatus Woesebacteria bacterium]
MKIHTFKLGQMQANCYLLEDDGKALLIDPADTADFILEEIQRRKLDLIGILATHGHFDHVMAVGEIQLSYPDLPLYINPQDEFLLKRVGESARHFLGFDPVVIPIGKTASLMKGPFNISCLPAGTANFSFQILETPGHTPGSCSFYCKEETLVFTGDTLFNAGIGRHDFAYSDKEKLKLSIQKLLKLPQETIVYAGHGEETSIDDEQGIIQAFF